LAFQFGCPLDVLRKALLRDPRGVASSPLGQAPSEEKPPICWPTGCGTPRRPGRQRPAAVLIERSEKCGSVWRLAPRIARHTS
jgi:hypothetical protein